MMKKYSYIHKPSLPSVSCALLSLLMLFSCSEDDILANGEKSQMVVEGWIKDGSYPVVMLTTSLPVSTEEKKVSDLEQNILNWGRVAISDGEKEVVLTGQYDDDYFPPYIYSTIEMMGEAGKTYTLDVSYLDYHATATTTIPATVPLQGIRQQKVENENSLWQLTALFTDPPGQQYYSLYFKKGIFAQQFAKCDVGLFDDSTLPGDNTVAREVSHPAYRTWTLSNVEDHSEYVHSEYFTEGDTVCIELCTLDQQSYNFWYSYQNSNSLSNNFFAPYTKNLCTNINGGLGYWCGYGASNLWTVVGKEDVYW